MIVVIVHPSTTAANSMRVLVAVMAVHLLQQVLLMLAHMNQVFIVASYTSFLLLYLISKCLGVYNVSSCICTKVASSYRASIGRLPYALVRTGVIVAKIERQ